MEVLQIHPAMKGFQNLDFLLHNADILAHLELVLAAFEEKAVYVGYAEVGHEKLGFIQDLPHR